MRLDTKTTIARPALLAAAGLALATSSLPALADSYFLDFDGVTGSSTLKGYEGKIAFDSFNWGISVPKANGGAGAGKPVLSDFSWTQQLDASTNSLFFAAVTGQSFDTVVVDFVTTQTGSPKTYFEMTFENAVLTSLDLNGAGGSTLGVAGSFSYDKVTLDYWSFDKSGKAIKEKTASYNLKTNTGTLGSLVAVYAQGVGGPVVAQVPEPESYAMFLAGLGLLGAIARRRKQAA